MQPGSLNIFAERSSTASGLVRWERPTARTDSERFSTSPPSMQKGISGV